MNSTTPIAEIQARTAEACRQLREKGHETVSPDLAEVIIGHLFTDRARRGVKRTRARAKPSPLTAHELHKFQDEGSDYELRFAADTTSRLLRWHGGNGELTGLFLAKSQAGAMFDRLDTLAQTLTILSGRESTALAGWKATGLFQDAPEGV